MVNVSLIRRNDKNKRCMDYFVLGDVKLYTIIEKKENELYEIYKDKYLVTSTSTWQLATKIAGLLAMAFEEGYCLGSR